MLATETVRALLVAKMMSLGMAAKEFRDEDDAATADELPFVLVQQAGAVDIDYIEGTVGGMALHACSYFLSFAAISRESAVAMLTTAVNALANDYTLGDQVLEIVPVSYGDEDNDGKDIRAIMLEIRVRFCTSPNDFGTLLT